LASLPETAEEVCDAGHDLGAGETDIRLAERATEHELKTLSADGVLLHYRTLHFATHGVLAGELGPMAEAGIILTPPASASAMDDGFLTASEISELRLDALVILSACNTAGASRAGAEALSGMARAFIDAGARSLLVSHWEVDSDATVQLSSLRAPLVRRLPTRKLGAPRLCEGLCLR
jgi:CHAT domain-containing protein